MVGLLHAMYNVQLSDKYENILKGMCWNCIYLIVGLEDQYVGNWQKQLSTNFQCGNTCWGGGYAHIVVMAMADAAAYI